MDRIIDDLQQLIAIESVSGNEREIADFLERTILPMPGELVRHDDNLIWKCQDFASEKPTVMLVAHIDTVPFTAEDWKVTAPLRAIERDGKIYGRGACDMKAGAAIILDIMRQSVRTSVGANLIAVFYADEEHGVNNGIRTMIEKKQLPSADFAIVLEPTNAEVNFGVLGYLDLRITARGKAAHSSRPEEGENAIAKLVPMINTIQSFPRTEFRGTLTSSCVTQINGGNAPNVVPDSASIHANFRFDPSLGPEALVESLRIPAADFDHRIVVSHSGYIADFNHPQIQRLIRISESEHPFVAPFWSDIDRLGNEMGIPAVNFGPGNIEVAHAADEWVEIAKIEQVRSALLEFLEINPH